MVSRATCPRHASRGTRIVKKDIRFCFLAAALVAAGCGEKKVKPVPQPHFTSAADLKVPENVPPPVETQPFEDGFAAGTKAGETAGRVRAGHAPRKLPPDSELEVLALEVAGTNLDRGPKWQRGFVSGYREGFERVAKGIR